MHSTLTLKLFGKRTSSRPVNRLEELLLAAANDVSMRPQFYRELLNFDLYVLGEAVGPSKDLGGGQRESLGQDLRAQGYNVGSRMLVALFSSEERIREALDSKAFDQAKYIRMNARALFESFPQGTPFILNPKSSFGKEFEPQEVKAILDGSIFQKPKSSSISPGEQYYLGKPAIVPQKLIAALSAYFQKSDVVKEAYLAEIYVPSSGDEPHLILGIGLRTNASRRLDDILPEIGMILEGITGGKEPVDIIEMGTGQLQSFIREQTEPFFVR
jgi:hypothetical protein